MKPVRFRKSYAHLGASLSACALRASLTCGIPILAQVLVPMSFYSKPDLCFQPILINTF